MRQAGAVSDLQRVGKADAAISLTETWPRGPEGEVAEFKLCSSGGWPLDPDECRVLGERLQRWLESGPMVEFGGARFELTKGARGRDDKEARLALEGLARFFLLASQHDGAVAR
jgi:hypothetical protein